MSDQTVAERAAGDRVERLESEKADVESAAAKQVEAVKSDAAMSVAELKQEADKKVAEARAEAEKWRAVAETERGNAEAKATAESRVERLETERAELERRSAAEVEQAREDAKAAASEAAHRTSSEVESARQEAEKWRALAEKNEQRANENLAAGARADALEQRERQVLKEAEAKVREAEANAKAAAGEAVAKSSQDVDEWQAEAERWKQISRDFEASSKDAYGAVERVKALETEIVKRDVEAEEAERRAATRDLEKAREQTAEKFEVPYQLRDRLDGTSREEIEDQAAELMAAINPQPEPAVEGPDPVAEAESRATEAELRATRLELAAELGVPPRLVDFIKGDDRESLKKSAQELAGFVPREQTQTTQSVERRPGVGKSGAVPTVQMDFDAGEIADRILKQKRGY